MVLEQFKVTATLRGRGGVLPHPPPLTGTSARAASPTVTVTHQDGTIFTTGASWKEDFKI